MNSETSAIRYEFYEGLGSSNPATVQAFEREFQSDVLTQAQEGYLFNAIVTDDDVVAAEYRFSPEVQAGFTDPNVPFNLFNTDDFAEFEAEIQKQDALGNDIVNLNFSVDTNGENLWNAYFAESTGPSFYTFSEDSEEFTELLASSSEANRSLLDIEYGDGTWIATLDESGAEGTVSFDSSFTGLERKIAAQDSRGRALVDLEYGDGLWIARYDVNSIDSTFTRSADSEIFQEEVAELQADGFDLVDVEYVADTWFGVFNEAEVTTGTTPDAPLPDITTSNPAPLLNELPEVSEFI